MTLTEKIKLAKTQQEFNEAVLNYAKLIGYKELPKETVLHNIYKELNITFKDGFFIKDNKLITEQQIKRELQDLNIWKSTDLNTMIASFMERLADNIDVREIWLDNKTTTVTEPNALYEALITKDVETLLVAMIHRKIEYFTFLYGVGEAGKSIITRIMTKVFQGYTGVSTLNQLQTSFGLQAFYGKLFMYGDDLGDESLKDGGTIKSATSGDTVNVNIKYKPQVDINPVANIMFNTNLIPYLDLRDDGILRRLQIISFTKKLDVGVFLDDDEVLEHMIDQCSQYLIYLAKTTTITRQQLNILNDQSRKYYYDNSVYKVDFEGAKDMTFLYGKYCSQCNEDGRRALSKQKFAQVICQSNTLELTKVGGVLMFRQK